MGTAVDTALRLHAVAHHSTPAMFAARCERMNRTLEAIKDMDAVLRFDLKRFIVLVAAYFTLRHPRYPPLPCLYRRVRGLRRPLKSYAQGAIAQRKVPAFWPDF